MFFLPLGYDALFLLIMNLTGSYWITDLIFYLLSASFLGYYFYLSKINPIDYFRLKALEFRKKIILLFKS